MKLYAAHQYGDWLDGEDRKILLVQANDEEDAVQKTANYFEVDKSEVKYVTVNQKELGSLDIDEVFIVHEVKFENETAFIDWR